MDSEYLRRQLGPCLVDCLTEVSQKRPHDPIEYMAQWLYKHLDNINTSKQKVIEAEELERQREVHATQMEQEAKMKAEKEILAREEMERKKAEEVAAATPQGLPAVVEEESPENRTAEGDDASPKEAKPEVEEAAADEPEESGEKEEQGEEGQTEEQPPEQPAEDEQEE